MYSNVASIRHRALLPAQQLVDRGINTCLISPQEYLRLDLTQQTTQFDVIYFDKLNERHADFQLHAKHLLHLAEQAKQQQMKVLLDVSNDILTNQQAPQYTAYLKFMLPYFDAVIVNHAATGTLLEQSFGLRTLVCPEGFEYDFQPVAENCFSEPLVKLLWFGHLPQIDPLLNCLVDLQRLAEQRALRLTVFTREHGEIRQLLESYQTERFQINFELWELDRQRVIFREHDAVILPEDRQDTCRAATKCVEALHAGCPVIASTTPFYQEFAPFIGMGDDFPSLLATCLAEPERMREKTALGQAHVLKHYNQQQILENWYQAYQSVLDLKTKPCSKV